MLFTSAAPNRMSSVVPLPAAAFLFVDIVGFTSFTEEHGDESAAQLAWRLRVGVEQQLCADAHVVKSLGDAVMVRIADPAEAAAAGARIAALALPRDGDPQVRVGIHYGPAIECGGDFFGAAVNVAARIAALAGPGEVLMSDALVCAAGARGLRGRGLEPNELGERALRNVSAPVLLHSAAPAQRTSAAVRAPGGAARRTHGGGQWAILGRELVNV